MKLERDLSLLKLLRCTKDFLPFLKSWLSADFRDDFEATLRRDDDVTSHIDFALTYEEVTRWWTSLLLDDVVTDFRDRVDESSSFSDLFSTKSSLMTSSFLNSIFEWCGDVIKRFSSISLFSSVAIFDDVTILEATEESEGGLCEILVKIWSSEEGFGRSVEDFSVILGWRWRRRRAAVFWRSTIWWWDSETTSTSRHYDVIKTTESKQIFVEKESEKLRWKIEINWK